MSCIKDVYLPGTAYDSKQLQNRLTLIETRSDILLALVVINCVELFWLFTGFWLPKPSILLFSRVIMFLHRPKFQFSYRKISKIFMIIIWTEKVIENECACQINEEIHDSVHLKVFQADSTCRFFCEDV